MSPEEQDVQREEQDKAWSADKLDDAARIGSGYRDWEWAARRLGEMMSADGPKGYYQFTPEQLVEWASSLQSVALPESGSSPRSSSLRIAKLWVAGAATKSEDLQIAQALIDSERELAETHAAWDETSAALNAEVDRREKAERELAERTAECERHVATAEKLWDVINAKSALSATRTSGRTVRDAGETAEDFSGPPAIVSTILPFEFIFNEDGCWLKLKPYNTLISLTAHAYYLLKQTNGNSIIGQQIKLWIEEQQSAPFSATGRGTDG